MGFVALVVARNSSEESGESGEEMEKSEGLCMDPREVAYWCTVNTGLGQKLVPALGRCSSNYGNETEEMEPAGRKERGKARSVPVLTRWRPGSWRNTNTSSVCSMSLAGFPTPATLATQLPRLILPLSHPT